MYPTTAELVAASSSADLEALAPEQQDDLRAAAIAAVEEHTGQRFEPEAATKLVDGSGSAVLLLPARLELMTGFGVEGGSLTLSDVLLSDKLDKLTIARSGFGYYAEAMRETELTRQFPYGTELVEITGVWGWTDCPEAVKVAIRYDMEEQAAMDRNELTPTIAAYRKLGIRDISQGNLRAALGPEGPALSVRVQRKLSPYVWPGVGGVLV